MIFSRRTKNICWVCYSTENLTGEHKIKKTDLQRNPVTHPGYLMLPEGGRQIIQGLKSKLLKFPNSICATCNNQRTQNADRSYDAFMKENAHAHGLATLKGGDASNYSRENSVALTHRTELARYFAKHLGCALDYQNFPVPRRLSRFVAGKTSSVCISLTTRIAPFWWQTDTGEIGPLNSIGAATLTMHNGFVHVPNAYQSAYITDGLQFIVRMPLNIIEALEIRMLYQKKMGALKDGFDNDDAKYRGLPYDEE